VSEILVIRLYFTADATEPGGKDRKGGAARKFSAKIASNALVFYSIKVLLPSFPCF
jgi:hypothetical protein